MTKKFGQTPRKVYAYIGTFLMAVGLPVLTVLFIAGRADVADEADVMMAVVLTISSFIGIVFALELFRAARTGEFLMEDED